MNHLDYMTEGTCSRSITIDVDENGIIRDLSFFGGCNGNLKRHLRTCHRQEGFGHKADAEGHNLRHEADKLP